MSEELVLPNSKYIDIDLGLKYLNANKKLYLKILNSFLLRYKEFDINSVEEDEFQNVMHTFKGLASTLGMVTLSNLAQKLHKESKKALLAEFAEVLSHIINDLNAIQTKTLLIIDDNSEDIDKLLEMLEDSYDIMVITSPENDLESIKTENIDIVLLNPVLSTNNLKHTLEQKRISIIQLHKPIDLNHLQLAIKNAQN